MLAKEILLDLFVPYFQNENSILKIKDQTLIEQVQSIIIAEGISDKLWPKILLAMIYISNLLLTSALNNCLLFEAFTQFLFNLQHLQVFSSTVYVFIYKKEQKAKSAKWKPRKKQEMLVEHDGYTIYCVYLPDKEKII